ncbi:MAG: hypothetical protein R3F53_23435 [Gammaproteobacteria bacterium]
MPARTATQLLRPPATVMRLQRLGSFHQTRLSFMRCLLRRIAQEDWRLTRALFELDADGYGTVVYRVATPVGSCSLVGFSRQLDPEERNDRVIAEKWDATFTLLLGEPDADDIERLRANVPLQEAGRVSARECVLSRANKSVRLFEYVVDCLAQGHQPNLQDIAAVGYLMRTTAVYGNGKFGLSDLSNTFAGGLFRRPFEAEMLTVYLIREFTLDLVEHIAAQRAPDQAVRLAVRQRRSFGIGNSTGLGMAPFLIAHPGLFHRWVYARETAIARVLALPAAEPAERAAFIRLLKQAVSHVAEWHTGDSRQAARITRLQQELRDLSRQMNEDGLLTGSYPWQRLQALAAAQYSEEMQELLHSLMIEPYGELVDELADTMADPEMPVFNPALQLAALCTLIEQHYDWALALDFTQPDAQHFFWYRSQEKEEPRLGERHQEPGADKEMRLDIAREVQQLYQELTAADPTESVAVFLLRQPRWRYLIRRLQLVAKHPYAEIRDNLLAAECLAVDLLRCKLSFFGAVKFDPRSDRWTRITMYQGAPCFAELKSDNADAWVLPVLSEDSALLADSMG